MIPYPIHMTLVACTMTQYALQDWHRKGAETIALANTLYYVRYVCSRLIVVSSTRQSSII